MVARFMTVGKSAGICAMVLALAMPSLNVWAADDKSDISPTQECKNEFNERKTLSKNAGKLTELEEEYETCLKNANQKLGGDKCEEDKKAFRTALSEAKSACTKAGIANPNKEALFRGKGCAEAIDLCECKDLPEDADVPSKCANARELPEVESDRFASTSTSDGGMFDMEKEKKQMQYCPAMSTADLKEFKKEVEEAQKNVDTLENEIPTLKDEVNQIQTDLSTKLGELEEQKRVAQKEYNDQKKALARKKKDDVKALEDQIMAIQENIDKIEGDIRAAKLSKVEAQIKRDEAVKGIYLACHNSATAEVSARRIELFKRLQAGQVNRGNFGVALKNVGLSDREADQRLANTLYTNCVQSKPTKDAIDTTNKMLSHTNTQIDATVHSLMQAMQRQNERINEIRDMQGCGVNGANSEKPMCRVLTEFIEDNQQLANDASQQAQKIANDVMRAQQDAYQKMITKREALAKKTEQLEREKNYLREKRELLAMKLRMGGASSSTQEDISKAWIANDSLISAANNLEGKCCTGGKAGEMSSECNMALELRKALHPDAATDDPPSITEQKSPSGTDAGDIVDTVAPPKKMSGSTQTFKNTEVKSNVKSDSGGDSNNKATQGVPEDKGTSKPHPNVYSH